MNKEETKKAIEIMQAFVDGQTIQTRYKDRAEYNDSWFDTPCPRFNFVDDELEYRIKPEPFECWVNVYPDGYGLYGYDNEEYAKQKFSYEINGGRCAVHMREVE